MRAGKQGMGLASRPRWTQHTRQLPPAVINVWHQLGDGTLSDPVGYVSYDIPEPVIIGDANSDGWNDLIALHGGWTEAGIYYYRPSSGTLWMEKLYGIPYGSHYSLYGVALGDVSGDGLANVVLADYNNGVVVIRQRAREAQPGPPRADGSVSFDSRQTSVLERAAANGSFQMQTRR